jgi:predicted NBD/HSP70 family sugar kinase
MSGTLAPTTSGGQRTREDNLAMVLGLLADSARPLSRAELAGALGVTRATASSLVESLESGGLVEETGRSPSGARGRPGRGLRLPSTGPAGLGLEVGVDYLAAAVTDLAGHVRHRTIHPAEQRGRPVEAVLEDLAQLARRALSEVLAQGVEPVRAIVAVPGLVTPQGRVVVAPNLGWRDVDLRVLLRARPVLSELDPECDNEANLSALAELEAGTSGRTFLHLSGEIGVGAGIVLDGAVLRGERGWAGEIGHAPVVPSGTPCRCGSRGCLEQVAGQEALLEAAGLPAAVATALSGQPTAQQLVAAARAGDPALLAGLDRAADALTVALTGALNLLDIRTVVLGGLLRDLAPWVADRLEEHLARSTVSGAIDPPQVRAAARGADAAVIGAAGLAVQRVRARPARYLSPVA